MQEESPIKILRSPVYLKTLIRELSSPPIRSA